MTRTSEPRGSDGSEDEEIGGEDAVVTGGEFRRPAGSVDGSRYRGRRRI